MLYKPFYATLIKLPFYADKSLASLLDILQDMSLNATCMHRKVPQDFYNTAKFFD